MNPRLQFTISVVPGGGKEGAGEKKSGESERSGVSWKNEKAEYLASMKGLKTNL